MKNLPLGISAVETAIPEQKGGASGRVMLASAALVSALTAVPAKAEVVNLEFDLYSPTSSSIANGSTFLGGVTDNKGYHPNAQVSLAPYSGTEPFKDWLTYDSDTTDPNNPLYFGDLAGIKDFGGGSFMISLPGNDGSISYEPAGYYGEARHIMNLGNMPLNLHRDVIASVPEPASYISVLTGLAAMGLIARRRKIADVLKNDTGTP